MVRVTPPSTAADHRIAVTVFNFHPVVLLLGILGMAILWRVRGLVAARVAARRLATAAMGFIAVLLVMSLLVGFTGPGPLIPSSRLLNWKLNTGALGSRNMAADQTANLVAIEVEHPACIPIDGGPWIADPMISSTPWSVTITMRMNDRPNLAHCRSQQSPHEGSLPIVGGYLTGIFYAVQLGEPLGSRALFDGSSFPPVERSLR